jgi:hypothetical protein
MSPPQLPALYDHVGSFLRPAYLLEAREQKANGLITPAAMRAVEDRAITDGEFRRTYFHSARPPASAVTIRTNCHTATPASSTRWWHG